MIQSSIWEQLLIFFNILKNNQYVGIVLIVSVLLLIILIIASKFKNKKITKVIWLVIYLLLFGTFGYFYHKEILNLLDYLIENIVLFLFFPNLAVYILVLIITNIIITKSVFSNKINMLVKNINIVCFILFNIIFYLIIENIINNQINVYEQLSIYTNSNLLVLIELSMELFVLWLFILLIIKIINNLSNYTVSRKIVNNNLVLETNINEEELQKVINDKNYLELKPIEEISFSKSKKDISNKELVLEEVFPIKKKKDFIPSLEICEDEVNYLKLDKVPDKTLASYDDLFDVEVTTSNTYNTDNIFSNSGNYLKNIAEEIQELKRDTNDKNRIKTIYDQVVLHEKDLTLRDYNYLIDMLVNIKK